jgi:ADP-heptose:LPS heptosyltransferase
MIAKDLLRCAYLGARRMVLTPLALMRRRSTLPENCRKILLVRIDRIGDLVLSTPFLRNVRELFPSAEVVILGRSFARDLLHGGGLVDRILVFDQEGDAGVVRGLASEGYDLVVDMHYDYELKTAALTRQVRARCSVGFDIGGRGALFDVAVPAREKKHFIEETLDILRTMGFQPREYPMEVHLSPRASAAALDILARQGIGARYAVFHPGGFYPQQRWPAQKFAQLADLTAGLGLTPVLIGDREDSVLAHAIANTMTARATVICGQDIGVSAAAIARSTLFIGNNSGPLHIACAMNVPTISTMGPTDPVRFWPVSERAYVLRGERVEHISVEEMFAAAKAALSSRTLGCSGACCIPSRTPCHDR